MENTDSDKSPDQTRPDQTRPGKPDTIEEISKDLNVMVDRRKFRSQTSDNMDRLKAE